VILRAETWIRTSADALLQFFHGIEENYTIWHPDHNSFAWIEGRGVAEGVVSEFDETIAGKRQRKRMVFTRVGDGRIEFAPVSRLIRLLLPRVVFDITPDGDGCRFIQEVHVRFGPLGARLNRKEFEAVQQHMEEEGSNLKALMESRA
jgi:hypothetical protein